jgi:hypothetical protein
MKPLTTGLVLSLTVTVFYSLCALVWVALPDQFMDLMNAMFHGLDFRRLVTGQPYTWSSFLYSIIAFAVWFFLAGVFFAWFYNMLQPFDVRRGAHVRHP